jgi:branched-chain amino acid transport system substrate-binding protein
VFASKEDIERHPWQGGKEEIKMKCNEIKRYKIDKGRRTFLKKLSVMGAGIAVGGLPKLVHSQTKKEIVIGGIAPVSGFMAAVGQHEKNSFEMAFEEINAAGGIKSLGGAKIKALFGDDEGKPESGMAEAERLIRAGAVILIGCDLSHVTYATTAIAEKYKVCHIVPMSVADNITERGFKYTFRTTDRTAIQGRRIMRFIKALELRAGGNIKTGVIMYVDNLYGKSVADSVNNAAKETGVIKILDVIPYPQNPRDLTSEI